MIKKILNNLLTYFISGLLTGGVIAHEYTEQHWNSQCSEWVDLVQARTQIVEQDLAEIKAENDSLRRVIDLQELGLLK